MSGAQNTPKKKITVREFEEKVMVIEEIPITIRADRGSMVDDYDYSKKCAEGTSLTDWLDTRVKPKLGAFQVDVISPEYVAATPHGRTKVGTLRDKYEQ
jgi:hypothetical protein